MNELSRHIEALLLENDCVIVPGLGGFVAHATSAVRIEEEERFMPPTRVIGFNPQLQLNDGLLVQSFMSVYGNSFPEATRMVERKVRLLQQLLHEEGRVDLPNIGELSVSLHDSYTFHPYDHRLTTPSLYGLEGFTMKALPTQALRPPKPVAAPALHRTSRRSLQPAPHYRRWRQSAGHVAVAALLLLSVCLSFYISTPIRNTDVALESQACLSPATWMANIGSESLAITPIATTPSATISHQPTVVAAPVQVVAKADSATTALPQVARAIETTSVKTKKPASIPAAPAATKATPSPRWHLIVASVGSEKDARSMAGQLVKEGHTEAQAVIGDGKMRVSIASYTTEAAAYKALGELRKQPTYQSAWVLKRK